MLRPQAARWFEILAARDDATRVLEALARTGAVELEARPGAAQPVDAAALNPLLARYLDHAARYRDHWPPEATWRPSDFPEPPQRTLQRCLDTLDAWAAQAEPRVLALQRGEAAQRELQHWQRLLAALPAGPLDPARLAAAGPLLQVRLFSLPPGSAPAQPPQGDGRAPLLLSPLEVDGVPHLLAAGTPAALDALEQRVAALKGGRHAVPGWLQADPEANRAHIAQALQALAGEQARAHAALDELARRHELPRALGDASRLQWLLHNVQALDGGPLLCRITGWTRDATGDGMARALRDSATRALLHFPPTPEGARAPLLLVNPPWARPFELFSRALGMPAASEADPTPLLAIVIPLMFGYMFGDVGQGLLLAAVGWWLRDRLPIARLLMIGGLAAAAFGLLFGSAFGLHGLVPALWLHPLDDPLAVLLAPLAGGALLLTLGLGLDALSVWWRGELRRWLLSDAALIVVYLGLLAGLLDPVGWMLAAAAALYFCVGHALLAGRAAAGLAALGELVEKTLQILINTLSFARVGAFALAHAGLSSAIEALMDAADHVVVKALVLLLGNAVVIVLEAMVVSIQTTRLVLFEFFNRFMQGQGRPFKPLPAPPYAHQET
jgi:V/A-type H+-transporting ATPase subunit I